MELREFAESVLFAATMQEKLASPAQITDERPGSAILVPESPGRPPELRFKPRHSGKTSLPRIRNLERTEERGRLLHFFANHELLACELMALVLLRFPGAPSAFRRAVLQTLKEEQEHTRWYLRRMQECGVAFGELPVSGYFWRAVSSMEAPVDYVAGLSLTFEQANLDFARFFSRGFKLVGDVQTSLLLERIYRDEIGHVACGLNWFRKWKNPAQSDWDAFQQHLKFPLSPQRAKGPVFNVEGRVAAGFDRLFIDELNVFAQSKGRTPGVYFFNPFAEGYIAQGQSFTPNKHQQLLQADLETLPLFLCRQDDLVLVSRRPAASFLSFIKDTGYAVPEFVQLGAGRIGPGTNLMGRKISRLVPWAWAPDSLAALSPLLPNVTQASTNPNDYYNKNLARLYSKEWSAACMRRLLGSNPQRTWLCTELEIGVAASSIEEVLVQVRAIRARGHHGIIIKEALGVPGHNAIRLFEPDLLETQRRWIARAVENGRQLLVEPWLERVFDYSVQLEMEAAGLKLIGYSGLLTDWKGQYRGNHAWPGFRRRICLDLPHLFPGIAGISNQIATLYSEIFLALEQQLRATGYLGPLGIDAFVYREKDGKCRLKPIVEINPRYTMGRLTLELMHNVAPGSSGTLRLINGKMIKADGFADFRSWSRAAVERIQLQREGEPVPKIRQGVVLLSDPERAQVCLPVFEVLRPLRPEQQTQPTTPALPQANPAPA